LNTATEEYLRNVAQREKDTPINHFRDLQNQHRCESRSCRNFGLTCLVAQKRHYKLDSNDLKMWNNAILSGEATVSCPPIDLHPMLSTIVKKRKHRDDYSSEPEDARGSSNRYPKSNVSVHVHHRGSSKSRRYRSSSPPSSPPERNRYSRKPISVSPPKTPLSHQPPLDEYISWHIARNPEDTDVCFSALECLQRDHIKLNQIPLIDSDTWREYKIPLGIRMNLISDIGLFKREHWR
jgi:hypothetical protein